MSTDKLLSARLKINRAYKHINDVNAALGDYVKSNPSRIRGDLDPKTRCYSYIFESLADVPIEVGMAADDAL
jgi:hypothetical protein